MQRLAWARTQYQFWICKRLSHSSPNLAWNSKSTPRLVLSSMVSLRWAAQSDYTWMNCGLRKVTQWLQNASLLAIQLKPWHWMLATRCTKARVNLSFALRPLPKPKTITAKTLPSIRPWIQWSKNIPAEWIPVLFFHAKCNSLKTNQIKVCTEAKEFSLDPGSCLIWGSCPWEPKRCQVTWLLSTSTCY